MATTLMDFTYSMSAPNGGVLVGDQRDTIPNKNGQFINDFANFHLTDEMKDERG